MNGKSVGQAVASLFCTVIACSLLTACQPDPYPSAKYDDMVDRSLLTSDPCGPPCWYGIEPGDSREQTLQQLEEISVVDASTLKIEEETVVWHSTIPAEVGYGMLTFYDDELVTITYELQYQLTLEQLISVYGEPDGTHLFVFRGTRGVQSRQSFYWPEKGLGATLFVEGDYGDLESVAADSTIQTVTYYFEQTSIEGVFRELHPEIQLEAFLKNYSHWDGYGPLEL